MSHSEFLSDHFPMPNCPQCGVANPRLALKAKYDAKDHSGKDAGGWAIYSCTVCGQGIMVKAVVRYITGERGHTPDTQYWTFPNSRTVSEDLPDRAKVYLSQAFASLAAPDGAALLAASAVDAMLKARGFVVGSLAARIEDAEANQIITPDMAAWANEVRLSANEVRHADDNEPHRTIDEAQRIIEFATALGELLFTLPARIARGRAGPGVPYVAPRPVSNAPPPIEPLGSR